MASVVRVVLGLVLGQIKFTFPAKSTHAREHNLVISLIFPQIFLSSDIYIVISFE